MSSVIGSLRVNLGLDSAKFERGANQAQKRLKAMRSQFLAVSGVAAALGASLSAVALKSAAQIDKVAKSARRLDASIGAFKALELSAGEAGVSLASLADDIQTMNRELATIGKSGNGKRALDRLGLSLADLSGLDADEKIATIADRVKDLGLSSGETTAVLRDLGIRNREMALLMLQGGASIRAARSDIRDYGLEISAVDTSKIEAANDQLGRLGLITQYAGQELAKSLVPALGAMAQAMTNSLREGGLLRAMIDGFVQNLGTLSASLGVLTAYLGGKYVAALVVAKVGTLSLAGAFVALKAAVGATLFGAMVIGAGYLVAKFTELVRASGGFGEALGLVADVAREVWGRIQLGATAMGMQVKAVWWEIRAAVIEASAGIASKAAEVVNMVVGVYVGAFKAIVAVWDALPAAFARIGGLAVNGLIDAIGAGISGVIGVMNTLLEAVRLPTIPAPDLGAFKVEVGAAVDVAGKAGEAFAGAFSTQYVNVDGFADAARETAAELRAGADMARDLGGVLADGVTKPLKSVEKLGETVGDYGDAAEGAADSTEDLDDSLEDLGGGSSGGSAGKAGKAIEAAKTQAQGFRDAMAGAAKTAEQLGADKAGILISGIDGAANAFGDFVAGGLKDFKGFTTAVVSSFAGMISKLVAMAARNKFLGSFGVSVNAGGGGGGVAGTVAQAAGGGGAGFGGLATAASTFGTAALGGFTNALGATFGAGGSLGLGFASIGGQISAAMAAPGIASISAALGAVALPVAALLAAVSFFKKKVVELDRGINVSVQGMSAAIEGYKKINTKRFWGLSSKDSEEAFDGYDEGTAAMAEAIGTVQKGIIDAAAALGVGAEAFEGFTYSFQSSFKDMTDDQIQAELSEKFRQLGHDFAVLIPGLEGLTAEGALASDALVTLVNSLSGVNASFDALGFSMLDASLEGAALARTFVNIFGSLEGMSAATGAYYENFYTQAERTAYATGQMREALAELGVIMPASTEAFRNLVDQAQRAGDLDRVAKLINISGPFEAIVAAQSERGAGVMRAQEAARAAAESDLRAAFAREAEKTRDAFEASIKSLQRGLTSAREKLELSRSIFSALDGAFRARVFPSMEAGRLELDSASSYLRTVLASGGFGDVDDLRNALSVVADPSTDTYKTLEDYRRDFLRTSAVIEQLRNTAGLALSHEEKMVALLEEQVAQAQIDAERAQDLLQEQLDALLGIKTAFESLEAAILAFQKLSKPSDLGSAADGTAGIAGIYQDVLNRQPDGPGLAYYEGLQDAGWSLSEIRDLIAGSAEAMGQVAPPTDLGGGLEAIYQDVLNRAADDAGLAYYRGLQGAGWSLPEIRDLIAGSSEALGQVAGPAYHTGGIAGRGADEYSATLLRGEEVLAPYDPRHRGNLGAVGSRNDALILGIEAMTKEVTKMRQAAGETLTYAKRTSDGVERLVDDAFAQGAA
jgi:hypothetical protein